MSAVATTRGGPAQPTRLRNAHRFAPYYWRMANKAAHKIRRRPSPHPTEAPAAAGFRHAVASLRREGLLDPATMRTGELYDRAGLERLIDEAQRPDFHSWTNLGRIVTVELALRSPTALRCLPSRSSRSGGRGNGAPLRQATARPRPARCRPG